MNSLKDSLAFWATIVGTLLAIFGVIQSRSWLLGVGAIVVVGSIIALGYASKQRAIVKSAELKVAGRSIDSLNLASLRRHLNRTLVIQRAENVAVIEGEDVTITWDCTGYCRADHETAMEFSIDTDNNVPFEELECEAYDLVHDPGMRHGIRPILIGADGISKKVAVPFLAPLADQESFRVLLKCKLFGCMKSGIDYYTATLSFDQERVQHYTLRLTFVGDLPRWLRVYECRAGGGPSLLKDLKPLRKTATMCEYQDIGDDIPARSARIYVFSRPARLDAHRALEKCAEAGT